MNSIGHSWSRIKTWLRGREEVHELAPPATERDITLAEDRLGVRLPPEISESLRYHNGSGAKLYFDAGDWKDRHIHEHDKEGEDLRSPHPMWNSITSLLHHTAQALESGEELDGYFRPGGDEDFLLWRDTDVADAVEDAPKRVGKFGMPISE